MTADRTSDAAESKRLFRAIRRQGWIKNLLSRPSPIMRRRADEEREQGFAAAREVYQRNLGAFLDNRRNQLTDVILYTQPDDYTAVKDAFLWGIFDRFLLSRPPLPTEPHVRLMLYMCFFISREEQIPFVTARKRVLAIESRFNDADPLIDHSIEAGRLAYEDGEDVHLIDCYDFAISAAAIASFSEM